jgi:hypothetical protein
VKQGLSLTRPAPSITCFAMTAELVDVATHRFPAADLPIVLV